MVLINQSYRDIDLIDPNPWQTRKNLEADGIADLAKSILADGLQSVPTARNTEGDRCQLVFGHRRLAAYRLLVAQGHEDFRSFPVNIKSLTDEEMAVQAFTENEKREGLNPVERAQGIQRMISDFEFTQQQVADKLGIDRSSVSNSLRLLRIPEDALHAVETGVLPVRSAMALLPFYELTPLEIASLGEFDPEYGDFVALARSGAINSDAIRVKVDKYLDYLRSVAPFEAKRVEEELPIFTNSETTFVETVALPKDTDLTDLCAGVDDVQEVALETETDSDGENLDEEGVEPFAHGEVDAEIEESEPKPVSPAPQKSAPKTEPAPAVTEEPVETPTTMAVVWFKDGSASVSLRLAGSPYPRFVNRDRLTFEDFPDLLHDLGIDTWGQP